MKRSHASLLITLVGTGALVASPGWEARLEHHWRSGGFAHRHVVDLYEAHADDASNPRLQGMYLDAQLYLQWERGGDAHAWAERVEGARRYLQRSEPHGVAAVLSAHVAFFEEDYLRASEAAQRAVDLGEDSARPVLLQALLLSGQFDACAPLVAEGSQELDELQRTWFQSYFLALSGDPETPDCARALLDATGPPLHPRDSAQLRTRALVLLSLSQQLTTATCRDVLSAGDLDPFQYALCLLHDPDLEPRVLELVATHQKRSFIELRRHGLRWASELNAVLAGATTVEQLDASVGPPDAAPNELRANPRARRFELKTLHAVLEESKGNTAVAEELYAEARALLNPHPRCGLDWGRTDDNMALFVFAKTQPPHRR